MTRITLDAELKRKLLNLAEPIELCDENGLVVGQVFPAIDLSQFEPWEPPISEEELRRRETSDKWYSTQEVLTHLEKLK